MPFPVELRCSQCARPLPPDPGERARWANADLFGRNGYDEDDSMLTLLVCPDCRADDEEQEFDPGGGD